MDVFGSGRATMDGSCDVSVATSDIQVA
jgi:hypothetical protein